MDGWMVGWLDGWMDGWMDGWTESNYPQAVTRFEKASIEEKTDELKYGT